MELAVTIPGPPFAQGRPRAWTMPDGRTRILDPKTSRRWKAYACACYERALVERGLQPPAFAAGPVEVEILAVFPCPQRFRKKALPIMRRPFTGFRDWDNIAKAVCDAGNGLLYGDDRQIFRGTVTRVYGEPDEPPHVRVVVREVSLDGV